MKRTVVLLAFATGVVPAVQAQEAPVDCTPGSMSEDYGGPLSPNGISLISPAGDHFVNDDVRNGAIGKWTGENGCAEDQLPPLFSAAVSNAELWTVKRGRYTDFRKSLSVATPAAMRRRVPAGRSTSSTNPAARRSGDRSRSWLMNLATG